MKYHPILMSTDMVRAILDGRKTQTRRVLKPQPTLTGGVRIATLAGTGERWPFKCLTYKYFASKCQCPYGRPGDRLWVRESFYVQPDIYRPDKPSPIHYKADEDTGCLEDYVFKPSIFMPRWASRITLEITRIRAERVQDISMKDAIAEGMAGSAWEPLTASPGETTALNPKGKFVNLWDSINAKRGYPWESNPWVWVIEFKRLESE